MHDLTLRLSVFIRQFSFICSSLCGLGHWWGPRPAHSYSSLHNDKPHLQIEKSGWDQTLYANKKLYNSCYNRRTPCYFPPIFLSICIQISFILFQSYRVRIPLFPIICWAYNLGWIRKATKWSHLHLLTSAGRSERVRKLGLMTVPCLSLVFSRLPSQRHGDGPRHALIPGAGLQRQRQLWPLQDHSGDMHLWQQGHLLLRPRCGAVALQSAQARAGQTAPAHLRNFIPDEQGPAAKVCSVSDFSPPHWSVAYCTETGRRDSVAELRDQPSSWWGSVWVSLRVEMMCVCARARVCAHLSFPALTQMCILTT